MCGIASREEENFVAFENVSNHSSKYVVLIDPMDGSSGIDVNVSIRTIFQSIDVFHLQRTRLR